MNARNKLVTLAAFAGLATFAAAAALTVFSGSLSPDAHRDHFFTVGRGHYDADIVNLNSGDLDAKVFDEDGRLLDSDVLPDNNPVLCFDSDRRQTIKIRVINASSSRSADYEGTLDP